MKYRHFYSNKITVNTRPSLSLLFIIIFFLISYKSFFNFATRLVRTSVTVVLPPSGLGTSDSSERRCEIAGRGRVSSTVRIDAFWKHRYRVKTWATWYDYVNRGIHCLDPAPRYVTSRADGLKSRSSGASPAKVFPRGIRTRCTPPPPPKPRLFEADVASEQRTIIDRHDARVYAPRDVINKHNVFVEITE